MSENHIDAPIHVSDGTFEKAVLKSPLPVLVDFWAPWCGPCRMVAPVLDKLAKEYAGRLIVGKVNVDNDRLHAGGYGVQGIPTLLFVKDGQVVETDQGYVALLLPSQTLGMAGGLDVQDGVRIARIEIQVKAGSFEASDPVPYFTSENVTYRAGTYSSKVTGEIVSPYTRDITKVRVSAICYDEAGEIIGGGFTYLDFVLANGKAAVEVSIASAEAPARTELYATVSGLLDYD